MPERLLRIRGCEPLLFRDGRPFADEIGALTAESLALPLPGTLAGLLRTRLGEAGNWLWDAAASQKAYQVSIAGPVLALQGQPVFPAPADALHYEDPDERNRLCLMPLRPQPIHMQPIGGCDMPHPDLEPLTVTKAIKPKSTYRYWPWESLQKWLLDAYGTHCRPLAEEIAGLPGETRTHVKMDGLKGIGEEGKLFHAEFRAFEEHRWNGYAPERHHDWSLLARMTTDETASVAGVSPFGGERRLAQIEEVTGDPIWTAPAELKAKLADAKRVRLRLVLATPALFAGGWKPGWLDENLAGNLGNVSLKLVSAAVGRREAVSGWDFQKRGPKCVRWMVPAGSVYFFEVTAGDAATLVETFWLQSVCDAEQDQRDGYGLALWGIF